MTPLHSVLKCMMLVAVVASSAAASYGDNAMQEMPLVVSEKLSGSCTMAMQAAAGGGHLKNIGGAMHLTLKNADNMTAVVRDPMKVELGIEMVPHAAMNVALPAFAVMLANLTDTAETTLETFQVIGVQLQELVKIEANGHLTYRVEIIDADISRGGETPAQPSIDVLPASEEIPVEITNYAQQALSLLPKRAVPNSFMEGTLLIDLTDPYDVEKHPISIRRMAENGEFAHNINKFLSNPDEVVRGQGVLTIGWMLPWSLWAWICCPAFFFLTPWAVPLWFFCCV